MTIFFSFYGTVIYLCSRIFCFTIYIIWGTILCISSEYLYIISLIFPFFLISIPSKSSLWYFLHMYILIAKQLDSLMHSSSKVGNPELNVLSPLLCLALYFYSHLDILMSSNLTPIKYRIFLIGWHSPRML